MKKKYFWGIIVLLLFLAGCGKSSDSASTVGDLAYNKTGSEGLVYIMEDGEYAPYIVLTDNYNGNALLLRKNVDENYKYNNNNVKYQSFYADSEIDKYLENTVYESYDDTVKNIIRETSLDVATTRAIEEHLTQTGSINRKVFLLSMYEYGGDPNGFAAREGTPLEYFSDNESRAACDCYGVETSFFTRSAAFQGKNSVYSISKDGSIGVGGINGTSTPAEGGVRPAFCIPSDTKLKTKSGVAPGENGYILAP